MTKVALSVAEKPSVAKELANILSKGRAQRVRGNGGKSSCFRLQFDVFACISEARIDSLQRDLRVPVRSERRAVQHEGHVRGGTSHGARLRRAVQVSLLWIKTRLACMYCVLMVVCLCSCLCRRIPQRLELVSVPRPLHATGGEIRAQRQGAALRAAEAGVEASKRTCVFV